MKITNFLTKLHPVHWYLLKNYSFHEHNEIGEKYQVFQWNPISFSDIHWKIIVFNGKTSNLPKIMKISNFPLKCPTVWSPCLKNYVFFTVLLKNYSFQGKSWKSQILVKTSNVQFSGQTDSRSVHFNEKIQILSNFFVPTNPQNLMKSWKSLDFLEKYIILKHFTWAFQW